MRKIRNVTGCVFGLIAVLAVGACTPQQIGPSKTQDVGRTEMKNQPVSAVGIIEEPVIVGNERITYLNRDGNPFKTEPMVERKTNYSAEGIAATQAVTIGSSGVKKVGTGPASAQLFWDGKNFTMSSDLDSKADTFEFSPNDGTVKVVGFQVSASAPTKALAVPLAEFVKIVEALTPAQRDAAIAQIEANRDVINAAVPTLAEALVKILAPVP